MPSVAPAFATDPSTAAYYERRAPDFDEWYTGEGRFAERDRPGWPAEVEQLIGLVQRLRPARTLDIACGTAFLTRHLHGFVVGLDQSPSMVAIAQSRLPEGYCADPTSRCTTTYRLGLRAAGRGEFPSAYCQAASGSSAVANAYLWSATPSGSQTSASGSPSFNPNLPSCDNKNTVLWQYSLEGTSKSGYDQDELAPDRRSLLW